MPTMTWTRSPLGLLNVLVTILLLALLIENCPAVPIQDGAAQRVRRATLQPSPLPLPPLTARSTPDDVYEYYSPQRRADTYAAAGMIMDPWIASANPPPTKRQADQPSQPLASYGPPSFPSNIPSCVKCQANYPSLSSCMAASSVFANATSLFNNPIAYINVLKCACTDTFQAVYPQCLDCFQNTDQCYYLGTDPKGTGAGTISTNIRNICALGSSLLGGVASANGNIGTSIISNPPSYTDVSTTAAGYIDQSTGAIFQSSAIDLRPSAQTVILALMISLTLMAVLGGGAKVLL